MIIAGNIDVKKILKEKMRTAKNGAVYLDITLLTKKEPDQYGNDGMIVQDMGKEARLRKEKGPILGNFRIMVADKPDGGGAFQKASSDPKTHPPSEPHPDEPFDDVPF